MKPSQTRLAILGTISDLHQRPISYDLNCLQKIVAELSPDLLCAEITQEAWERADFSQGSLEVRKAFAPIIESMDIILIPVAPSPKQYEDFTSASGWRHRMVRNFDRLLRWAQIQANDVKTINGLGFGAFCHTVCWFTELFWSTEDRKLWERQNRELAENIVRALERDRGGRVLVAVRCQRLHRLIPLLHAHDDLFKIVAYQKL